MSLSLTGEAFLFPAATDTGNLHVIEFSFYFCSKWFYQKDAKDAIQGDTKGRRDKDKIFQYQKIDSNYGTG